jgi:hypothetical protein
MRVPVVALEDYDVLAADVIVQPLRGVEEEESRREILCQPKAIANRHVHESLKALVEGFQSAYIRARVSKHKAILLVA